MQLTTPVTIPQSPIKLQPQDDILFVGSCFADNIGKLFVDNGFKATVNPFGVMYNPVSILHTLDKYDGTPSVALFTLGTNHVYREKASGEIVDNCQKRPQKLFQEEVLSVENCVEILHKIITHPALSKCKLIIFTVSPIRYKKYGFHESQLSKATLQLAVDEVIKEASSATIGEDYCHLNYFPAYEIVLDELRDYRFYASDMIHPSEQAVDYIFERFRDTFFSKETNNYYTEYQPIKHALNHKPFNPDSEEYKEFLSNTRKKLKEFLEKWGCEDQNTSCTSDTSLLGNTKH